MAPIEKTEKKKGEITDKEAMVLALAWQCFKNPPEVDVDKLAKLAGYNNPRSVSNLLSGIKKKMAGFGAGADGNGGEGPATPAKTAGTKTKTTPASRKRKTATEGDDDDDSSTPATPAKRARGKKAILSKATVGGDDSEEDKKSSMKKDAEDEAVVD
ncbi:hypothetical protein Hte_008515 [Hypoxylon texense]